jgi:hypothetical protein
MRKIFALWGYIGLSTLFSAAYSPPPDDDLNVMNTVNSVYVREEEYVPYYSGDDLRSYAFSYVNEVQGAMQGDVDKNAALFAELKNHVQTLTDAMGRLPADIPDKRPVTDTDLSAVEEVCIKIVGSLNIPKKLIAPLKKEIGNVFQNGRVCMDPEGSDRLALFREKHLLPRSMDGYYSNGDVVVAAKTRIAAISAVFSNCGGAVAEQWLNCGNQNNCFSLFFQIAAFFSAIKQRTVTRGEACRMVRRFLIVILAGLQTAVVNKKICDDGLSGQKKNLSFSKYADFLLEGLEKAKLTDEEKEKIMYYIVTGVQAFQANPSKYIRGGYAIAAIFSLIEYVKLEKMLRNMRSEEDKEPVILFYMTRIKLMHEKLELWKRRLCGNRKAEVKEALDFLMQEIKNLSDGKDAAPKAKPEMKAKAKIKVKEKGNAGIKSKKKRRSEELK